MLCQPCDVPMRKHIYIGCIPAKKSVRHKLGANCRQGVAFDKDGTLTLPYADSVHPDLQQSLDACSAAFDCKVVLFSNSAGLFQFDPEGRARVTQLANTAPGQNGDYCAVDTTVCVQVRWLLGSSKSWASRC